MKIKLPILISLGLATNLLAFEPGVYICEIPGNWYYVYTLDANTSMKFEIKKTLDEPALLKERGFWKNYGDAAGLLKLNGMEIENTNGKFILTDGNSKKGTCTKK